MNNLNTFFVIAGQYLQGKIKVVYGAFYAVCSAPVEAECRPAKKLGISQIVKKELAHKGKKEVFKPVLDGALAV